MNLQTPEPVQRIPEGFLELHHLFPTIQGEGPFAGMPAVFVRLAGCNLQCPWCDTDYTSRRELVGPTQIVKMINDLFVPARLVVITGGEPFRQSLGPLVRALDEDGYTVQIETNGTLYDAAFPYELATVVCSPKTPKLNPHLWPHIAALKYVLDADHVDPNDGLPASTMGAEWLVARPPEDYKGEVYVQPLDVSGNLTGSWFVSDPDNQRHTSAAVVSAMRYGYRLCIQTHKLTGLE